MTTVLKDVEEKLVDYGTAITGILKSTLPVFDEILDRGMRSVKKVVGMRQEVIDIQRKARVDYLKALIEAGVASASATAILRQELDLDHGGFFKTLEVVGSIVPMIEPVFSTILNASVIPFMASRGVGPRGEN